MQKNQKKITKKFFPKLANFWQKMQVYSLAKMSKFGPKIFFSEYHGFFLSIASEHSKNAKKIKKKLQKNFSKIGQFLAKNASL